MNIIYFELNNWIRGKDYPNAEPYISWVGNDLNLKFRDKEWVKENKLCIVEEFIDMSVNWCATATREWVEQNYPSLLNEFQKFQRFPDEYGDVLGGFDTTFLDYCEENIGLIHIEEDE